LIFKEIIVWHESRLISLSSWGFGKWMQSQFEFEDTNMKPISAKNVFRSLAAVALTITGGSVFAASTSWNVAEAPADLVLSGYTNGTGNSSSPGATSNTASFKTASVYNWGVQNGMGVISGNETTSPSGPHAIDNGYGIEALMINFTTGPVNLTGLTLGWNGTDTPATSDNNGSVSGGGTAVNYNDSDLSVFVWTGAGIPPLTTLTPTTLALTSSGWTLVGNYADVGSGSNTESPLGTSLYSSYWLVSAYSSAYGSTNKSGIGSLDQGNDAFKLLSVAGNTCAGVVTNGTCGSKVPEPGSLALMGIAMAGFVATRRRKPQAV